MDTDSGAGPLTFVGTATMLIRFGRITLLPHASRRLEWRGFPRALGLRTWTSHTNTAGRTGVRVNDDYPFFHSPLDDFRAEVMRRGWGERVRFVQCAETIPLTPVRSTPVRAADPMNVGDASGRRLPEAGEPA